jgi:hypothetical protein
VTPVHVLQYDAPKVVPCVCCFCTPNGASSTTGGRLNAMYSKDRMERGPLLYAVCCYRSCCSSCMPTGASSSKKTLMAMCELDRMERDPCFTPFDTRPRRRPSVILLLLHVDPSAYLE